MGASGMEASGMDAGSMDASGMEAMLIWNGSRLLPTMIALKMAVTKTKNIQSWMRRVFQNP